MSCIKFPSAKSDLATSKSSAKESDYAAITNSLIGKANELFGERNWSHAITSQTLDFIDYVCGKYQAGCVSIVRIQLKDGIFHEDIGYNSSEGSSKGSAIQRVRLGSYNAALKKVLTYFESDVFNKETQSLSRSSSPVPIEAAPKTLPVEVSTTAPLVSTKIDSDQFEDIPMSQTDALMDTVDLDQICGKDQNSNSVVNATKGDLPKSNICTANDIPIYNTNGVKREIKDVAKQPAATVASSAITVPTSKKEAKINSQKIVSTSAQAKINSQKIVSTSAPKPEVSKPVVYTAMTEEEMRQERKRKQREMQEEFKRKEEIKRKHVDNGNVPAKNPRY